MIALKITSMKVFMNKLLKSDTFDGFLLEEATVMNATTHTIDGKINREFFTDDECPQNEFVKWSETKDLVFDLIKGKRTPLFFKFVLQLNPEQIKNVMIGGGSSVDAEHIKSLMLNIRFDQAGAVVTTGTGYYTFVMTKEPDRIWDEFVKRFFTNSGIEFEEL